MRANDKVRLERVEKILELADLKGCNIREIINEYSGVFGLEGEPPPATHLLQHRIDLNSSRPVKCHRFRFPPALKEHMLRELQKLREQNIVVSSNSNYSSALWIVPKKPDAKGNRRFRS